MQSTQLTCLLFNDLEPWERRVFEGVIEGLSSLMSVETVWVTESQRGFFKHNYRGNFWVISKQWYRALNFLTARGHREQKIFVSILDLNDEARPLSGLSILPLFNKLPKTVTLLVHNPAEYRFFNEIKKIHSAQLKWIELPFIPNTRTLEPSGNGKFVVGTLCQFKPESNVPFLLSLSHFVSMVDSQVRFRIMGRGPLYGHYSRMVSELGLENQVSIVETVSEEPVGSLDLFLYFPIRAPHFIPLLVAAANRVPVISFRIEGLEDWFGFEEKSTLVSNYEIKSIGSKILELKEDPEKRKMLALKFVANTSNKFSLENVSKKFLNLFSNDSDRENLLPKAA